VGSSGKLVPVSQIARCHPEHSRDSIKFYTVHSEFMLVQVIG